MPVQEYVDIWNRTTEEAGLSRPSDASDSVESIAPASRPRASYGFLR